MGRVTPVPEIMPYVCGKCGTKVDVTFEDGKCKLPDGCKGRIMVHTHTHTHTHTHARTHGTQTHTRARHTCAQIQQQKAMHVHLIPQRCVCARARVCVCVCVCVHLRHQARAAEPRCLSPIVTRRSVLTGRRYVYKRYSARTSLQRDRCVRVFACVCVCVCVCSSCIPVPAAMPTS